MSLFETIKAAIFGQRTQAAPGSSAGASGATPPTSNAAAAAPSTPQSNAPPQTSLTGADLDAKLNALNQKSPQKLNWQTSIVDLMKLVGLDPSLANRKQLAQELGYQGDTNDSATMNIWLHKQVMSKLQESGGSVPASLRG